MYTSISQIITAFYDLLHSQTWTSSPSVLTTFELTVIGINIHLTIYDQLRQLLAAHSLTEA
ncbi:MAG: hypothetical protein ACI3YI_11355 [Bacteroidaceae bacterium]